jgi:carbon storage regulator
MLVLTRKHMESIQIGPDVRITVVKLACGIVRLGIDAPKEVRVIRSELIEATKKDEKSVT